MALTGTGILNPGCTPVQYNAAHNLDALSQDQPNVNDPNSNKVAAMKIYYLEIVNADVNAACALYS